MTYHNLESMTEAEYVSAYNANQTDPDDRMPDLDAILAHDGVPVFLDDDYEDENGDAPVVGVVINDVGEHIWITDY